MGCKIFKCIVALMVVGSGAFAVAEETTIELPAARGRIKNETVKPISSYQLRLELIGIYNPCRDSSCEGQLPQRELGLVVAEIQDDGQYQLPSVSVPIGSPLLRSLVVFVNLQDKNVGTKVAIQENDLLTFWTRSFPANNQWLMNEYVRTMSSLILFEIPAREFVIRAPNGWSFSQYLAEVLSYHRSVAREELLRSYLSYPTNKITAQEINDQFVNLDNFEWDLTIGQSSTGFLFDDPRRPKEDSVWLWQKFFSLVPVKVSESVSISSFRGQTGIASSLTPATRAVNSMRFSNAIVPVDADVLETFYRGPLLIPARLSTKKAVFTTGKVIFTLVNKLPRGPFHPYNGLPEEVLGFEIHPKIVNQTGNLDLTLPLPQEIGEPKACRYAFGCDYL